MAAVVRRVRGTPPQAGGVPTIARAPCGLFVTAVSAQRQLVTDCSQGAERPSSSAPEPRRLRLRLLGIEPGEASFERRGFSTCEPAARTRLEEAGRAFVRGYRAALASDEHAALERSLAEVDLELRGFAYEGAAMAMAVLDRVAPWRRDRLHDFIVGPARDHVYMAHVGAGWALARLRLGPRAAAGLDPLLRWLALDGYGFHQGYFNPVRHLRDARPPRRFHGYALRAFDQGLGRSLWFAAGADPGAIRQALGGFADERRPDLWSGVGLAATYAGGATPEALEALRTAAASYEPHLAQGAAFAAAARERAANPTAHTELGSRLLAGRSARVAAAISDKALRNLPPDGAVPAYEAWRGRIRDALEASAGLGGCGGPLEVTRTHLL